MNTTKKGIILCCLIIIILCIYILFKHIHKPNNTDKIIFTCTTFFDFEKQDKWGCFTRAIDSIIENTDKNVFAEIDEWVIVNEYSEKPKKDWSNIVSKRYPFIRFIQKNKSQKGQAASMNIILKEIRPYKYWIHWEESWFCRNECISRMIDIIKNTDVTQLQVTQLNDKPNWLDIPNEYQVNKKTQSGTEYVIILPSSNEDEYKLNVQIEDIQFNGTGWPLYSLLPSINKVDYHRKTGKFNENLKYWPFIFELDYAKRWYKQGIVKAVLPDGPVIREKSHLSTYS